MASVNLTIHLGRLGKDVELRHTANGKAVANFSIACSESYTVDGEKKEKTEWVTIVVWDRLAELCAQYLSKGREVYVEGALQTRNYEDASGTKKYITEVIARKVQFLGGNSTSEKPQVRNTKLSDSGEEDLAF